VVLLDVGLPDASGIELARTLCARYHELEVVLVSTHDVGDYALLAASSGARGFLAKADLSGDALHRMLSG
jgi:DNA-binding NarL/FixJ family response regulator